MTQKQISEIADEIIQLYQCYGADDYVGEPVSQLEHMSQSALLAQGEGYEEEVILAAFLHDIGHICSPQRRASESMAGYGVIRHEKVGADYLRSKRFLRAHCPVGRKPCAGQKVPHVQKSGLLQPAIGGQ